MFAKRLLPVRSPWRQSGNTSDGFTLIEVLVALTILGVSLAVLLGSFSQSLAVAHETIQQTMARTLTESLLAKAASRTGFKTVDMFGEEKSGIVWRLDIHQYGQEAQKSWPLSVVLVQASAYWIEDGHRKSITLRTLELAPKEPVS